MEGFEWDAYGFCMPKAGAHDMTRNVGIFGELTSG